MLPIALVLCVLIQELNHVEALWWKGSGVLKASLVQCWSIPSKMDILIDTQLIDTPFTEISIECPIGCQSSCQSNGDWVLIEGHSRVLIKDYCWSRLNRACL